MKTYRVQQIRKFQKINMPTERPSEWDEVKSILPGFIGFMLLVVSALYI